MDKPTEHSSGAPDQRGSATGDVTLTPNEARTSVEVRPSTKWILIGIPLTLIGFLVVWFVTTS